MTGLLYPIHKPHPAVGGVYESVTMKVRIGHVILSMITEKAQAYFFKETGNDLFR